MFKLRRKRKRGREGGREEGGKAATSLNGEGKADLLVSK